MKKSVRIFRSSLKRTIERVGKLPNTIAYWVFIFIAAILLYTAIWYKDIFDFILVFMAWLLYQTYLKMHESYKKRVEKVKEETIVITYSNKKSRSEWQDL